MGLATSVKWIPVTWLTVTVHGHFLSFEYPPMLGAYCNSLWRRGCKTVNTVVAFYLLSPACFAVRFL